MYHYLSHLNENTPLTMSASQVQSNSKYPPKVQIARNALRAKGWTQVEAANQLGVSKVHLCYVLTARRISASLLRRISKLPNNPNPA